MQTFVIDIEDQHGDLIDRRYYAGRGFHALQQLAEGSWVIPARAVRAIHDQDAGSIRFADGGFSWGYAPCAAEEVDYRVTCACGCGQVMNA